MDIYSFVIDEHHSNMIPYVMEKYEFDKMKKDHVSNPENIFAFMYPLIYFCFDAV